MNLKLGNELTPMAILSKHAETLLFTIV